MPQDTTRGPDPAARENENQKPGAPPRPSTEPRGGAASRSPKTQTDPATGETTGSPQGSEKAGA